MLCIGQYLARLFQSELTDDSLDSFFCFVGWWKRCISFYLRQRIPASLARLLFADIRSTIAKLVELVDSFYTSDSTESHEYTYMAKLYLALFVLAEYSVSLFWVISPDESCLLEIHPVIMSSTESDFYDESFYITKISLELVDALWSIRVVVVIKFAVILFDELCMSEEFFIHRLFLDKAVGRVFPGHTPRIEK